MNSPTSGPTVKGTWQPSRRAFLAATATAVVSGELVSAVVAKPAVNDHDLVERALDHPANVRDCVLGNYFEWTMKTADREHNEAAGGTCHCSFCEENWHAKYIVEILNSALDGQIYHSDAVYAARKGRCDLPIPDGLPTEERCLLAGKHFLTALDAVLDGHDQGGCSGCNFCDDANHIQWTIEGFLDLMGGEVTMSPQRYALHYSDRQAAMAPDVHAFFWDRWLRIDRAKWLARQDAD